MFAVLLCDNVLRHKIYKKKLECLSYSHMCRATNIVVVANTSNETKVLIYLQICTSSAKWCLFYMHASHSYVYVVVRSSSYTYICIIIYFNI